MCYLFNVAVKILWIVTGKFLMNLFTECKANLGQELSEMRPREIPKGVWNLYVLYQGF